MIDEVLIDNPGPQPPHTSVLIIFPSIRVTGQPMASSTRIMRVDDESLTTQMGRSTSQKQSMIYAVHVAEPLHFGQCSCAASRLCV